MMGSYVKHVCFGSIIVLNCYCYWKFNVMKNMFMSAYLKI